MSSKLFTFNRSLPAPFDKRGKKVKVSSKYGDGTEATLSSTVVKAIWPTVPVEMALSLAL